MTKRIDINRLLLEGVRNSATKGNDNEKTKQGTLRGGSSGILLPDGNIAGECHRKAFARMKGSPILQSATYDEDSLHPEEAKQLMFAAGNLNEDAWFEWLGLSSYEGKILREEEIPSLWYTSNGTKVTGRPDIVLCSPAITNPTEEQKTDGLIENKGDYYLPLEGIELKLMCSFWTFRSVVLEGMPKFGHMIQAAQYSMALDIPYQLWYTSQMNYTGPEFLTSIVPKFGEAGSEKLEYTYGRYDHVGEYKSGKKKGQPKYRFSKVQVPEADRNLSQAELKSKYGVTHGQFKNTRPAFAGFILEWYDDTLFYRNAGEQDGELFETDITKKNIKDYYEKVSKIEDTHDLGPRPLTLKITGDEASYSQCDYCPFSKQCDKYEKEHKDFSEWISEIGINGSAKTD